LPEVPLISGEEEERWYEVSTVRYLKEKRMAAINRPHSLYAHEGLDLLERQPEEARGAPEEKMREHEPASFMLSIPGIGLGIAGVLLAYPGDGR
jgi:hypothetical protein